MNALTYLALLGFLSFAKGDAEHNNVEVTLRGNNPFTRQKAVQIHSISPLDRLLNQQNQDDEIQVQLSCQPRGSSNVTGTNGMQYQFKLDQSRINQETCSNGNVPASQSEECELPETDRVTCNNNEDYKIEMFNLMLQREEGLTHPPSMGSTIVTREMLQCLTDDKLKVHFEYGNRQEFGGIEACFDHTPYVNSQNGNEDNIPFTVLDICNKQNQSRQRCFSFSYQIALKVHDTQTPPMLENRIYTKITFKGFDRLVVLPGDQVKTRFTTEYSEQDAIRVMPDIYSPSMPSPIKERYQVVVNGSNQIALPCDDRKVADALTCNNFFVYCTSPMQRIQLTIQGTGNVYNIDETCANFMAFNDFDWNYVQDSLVNNNDVFRQTHEDAQGNPLPFTMDEVAFTNKHGQRQTEQGWFTFEYTVGSRLHSNEPRCFQGVQLEQQVPTCDFLCKGQDCLLQDPTNGRRLLAGADMLVAADGRPDTSEATPAEFQRRFLQKLAGNDLNQAMYYPNPSGQPLLIPTIHLNPGKYVVPDKLLQTFLNNYIDEASSTVPVPVASLEEEVTEETVEEQAPIEGDVTDGEAEPIHLSASFDHNVGTRYHYNIADKVKSDQAPPSAIKIERLPEHGKIVITEHDGTVRELQVGDIVSTKLMDDFQYEQGENACSEDNTEVCDDEFLYTTLSSWVGLGSEYEQQIRLNPVKVESSEDAQFIASPNIQEDQIEVIPDMENIQELNDQREPVVDVSSSNCKEYPHMLVNFMIGLLTIMVSAFIAMMVYISHLQKQKAAKQEVRKDFDSIGEASPEQKQVELK